MDFAHRHYAPLALAVLALATFNLTFRLGSELVTQWDESLYATSAWEMVKSGDWIATTFGGTLDYYNTKPPLNVWLIALAFKTLGVNLVSLRLPSVAAAWLTVVVLQAWVRRASGPAAALFSSLILATSFGFLHTHAGRTANPDALLALLVLLTVIVLWTSVEHPWRTVWLGPILSAAFLLKGMAVLMPLSIVASFLCWRAVRKHGKRNGVPLATGMLLGVVPIALWMWARWRVDQWRFIGRLFTYDFLQATLTALEGHSGTPLFYIRVFQRDQLSWLAAAILVWALFPVARERLHSRVRFWRGDNARDMLIGTWAAVTFLIPTVMRTKLPWYLNSFYPPFAVAAGYLVGLGASAVSRNRDSWRAFALVTSLAVALVASESRVIWYSFHNRDLGSSAQGVLLELREEFAGRPVFRPEWEDGDIFVIRALVQAEPRWALSLDDFLRDSGPGDFWLSSAHAHSPDLILESYRNGHWVYRRSD